MAESVRTSLQAQREEIIGYFVDDDGLLPMLIAELGVKSIADDVATLTTDLARLRTEFTDQLAAVNTRIDRIISETSTQIGTLRGEMTGRLDAFQGQVDNLASDVSDLRVQLGDMGSEVEDIRAEIEKTWQSFRANVEKLNEYVSKAREAKLRIAG